MSACYSGGFIDALKDDYTLVLTAAAADRASPGCGNGSDATTSARRCSSTGSPSRTDRWRVRGGAHAYRGAREGRRGRAADGPADLHRPGDGAKAEGARPRTGNARPEGRIGPRAVLTSRARQRGKCAARSAPLDGRRFLEELMRRLVHRFAAIAALCLAFAAPPPHAQALGEAEARRRRGRQDAVLLPAADDRRAQGLLQGRGPRRRDPGFPGRRARAAGAARRQRRHRLGRLRAHDHAAGEGPEHRGADPAGQVRRRSCSA